MAICNDMSGQVALVTGATGQLGRGIVRRLAEAGADVVVHYLDVGAEANYYKGDKTVNREMAKRLCAEVGGFGGRSMAVAGDVTDRETVFKMRDTIRETLGDPSIIVTAAMLQIRSTLMNATSETFSAQFATSVLQHLHIVQAFVPAMKQRRYGRIIGINSVACLAANEEHSPYSTAKMAMEGVFRQMAREFAEFGITANQVAPSWMYTDVERDRPLEPPPGRDDYLKRQPMKRCGTEVDIANAVAFLASKEAAYINGVLLPVNGGREFVGI